MMKTDQGVDGAASGALKMRNGILGKGYTETDKVKGVYGDYVDRRDIWTT